MRVGYVRVSTVEQNIERQIEIMKNFGVEKTFTDKLSGRTANRENLLAMLDFIREGDTVYIESFSRLARNTRDLYKVVDQIQNKGCQLVSHKENFDLSTPAGRLFFGMMGLMYEFEVDCARERQLEGIKIAKAKGVYKRARSKVVDDKFINCYERFMRRELTVKECMQLCRIKSRTTWYKLVEEYKTSNKE